MTIRERSPECEVASILSAITIYGCYGDPLSALKQYYDATYELWAVAQARGGGATNVVTPVHGLWTYGNWCGAGGGGTPTNSTDSACMRHDRCYSQDNLSPGSNFGGPNAKLQSCNQSLCNEVRARRDALASQAAARQRKLPFFASAPPVYTAQEQKEGRIDSEINFYFTYVIKPWGSSCH